MHRACYLYLQWSKAAIPTRQFFNQDFAECLAYAQTFSPPTRSFKVSVFRLLCELCGPPHVLKLKLRKTAYNYVSQWALDGCCSAAMAIELSSYFSAIMADFQVLLLFSSSSSSTKRLRWLRWTWGTNHPFYRHKFMKSDSMLPLWSNIESIFFFRPIVLKNNMSIGKKFCGIVLRQTRDSVFNHPWEGGNPEGPSLRIFFWNPKGDSRQNPKCNSWQWHSVTLQVPRRGSRQQTCW